MCMLQYTSLGENAAYDELMNHQKLHLVLPIMQHSTIGN